MTAEEFNAAPNKKKKCTLFWVWPEQFRSYVVPGYLNYTRGLFKSSNVDDYGNLLNDINDNKSRYFKYKSDGSVPDVSLGMSATDLQTCSLAYNEGDEYLGNSVDKYQIRLTASAKSEKSKTNGTEGAK